MRMLFFAPSSDRKSTRLNSSHLGISYAVFCLKQNSIRFIHIGLLIGDGFPFWLQRCDGVPFGGAVAGDDACLWDEVAGPSFFFLIDRAPPELHPFPFRAPFRI